MVQYRNYFAGDRSVEEQRLIAQGKVLDPVTRRLLETAGLAPGMRVLDLGSGAGNVTLLAAELVGSGGHVVGVERDPDAVRLATELAAELGVTNVEFRQGDLLELPDLGGEFDAMLCRAVLAYLSDPTEALRQAASQLRPGGLVCVEEFDLRHPWTSVDTPLWRQIRQWTFELFDRIDTTVSIGPLLYSMFQDAGLPAPELRMEAFVGGGDRAPAFGWANFIGAAIPLMERFGIATAEEIDEPTLTDRLLADVHAERGVILGPCLYGAWVTKPS